MPRQPPPRTEAQERDHRRRQALSSMDVTTLRVWLKADGFDAFGDDATVLQAAHEARILDPATPSFQRQESARWLREYAPMSDALLTDRQIVKRTKKR